MNDYGLRPYTLLNIIRAPGVYPKNNDVYEELNLYEEDDYGNIKAVSLRGNTNIGENHEKKTLDWDTWQLCGLDIRMFYAE